MFNDERERLMNERDPYGESIQDWAIRVQEQHIRHSLRSRVLKATGKELILLGEKLTERFGAGREEARPRDPSLN